MHDNEHKVGIFLCVALVFTLLALLGCQTTTTYDDQGNVTSETRSFEVTAEQIALLETLHSMMLDSIETLLELKADMDAAEFEQELAEREAKAEALKDRIEALKAVLEAIPQPEPEPDPVTE